MVATHLRQSRPSHVNLHSVLNKYTENFILVSVVIFEPQIFSDFRLPIFDSKSWFQKIRVRNCATLRVCFRITKSCILIFIFEVSLSSDLS